MIHAGHFNLAAPVAPRRGAAAQNRSRQSAPEGVRNRESENRSSQEPSGQQSQASRRGRQSGGLSAAAIDRGNASSGPMLAREANALEEINLADYEESLRQHVGAGPQQRGGV